MKRGLKRRIKAASEKETKSEKKRVDIKKI